MESVRLKNKSCQYRDFSRPEICRGAETETLQDQEIWEDVETETFFRVAEEANCKLHSRHEQHPHTGYIYSHSWDLRYIQVFKI